MHSTALSKQSRSNTSSSTSLGAAAHLASVVKGASHQLCLSLSGGRVVKLSFT